jgi:hypothetical protein
MAMVLKLGAGGDAQDHVSTPLSVKDKYEPEPLKKNNNQQRASSASVYHPNILNKDSKT